jgi:hypothetical protein
MINAGAVRRYFLLDHPWGPMVALIVLIGVAIMTFTLPLPYSYWLDEMWSVWVSSKSWSNVHTAILRDVHPPLYQIALKLWMAVFGTGEPATRSLSWLCGLCTIAVGYRSARRFGLEFATCFMLVLASNPMLAFYANETRSYALVLLLATVVSLHFPYGADERPSRRFLVSCVLLSLTHYFGLVLSGIALAASAASPARARRDCVASATAGLLCLLWPVYHVLAGSIGAKTGGHFWITVAPVVGTVNLAANALLPLPSTMKEWSWVVFTVLSVAALVLARVDSKGTDRHAPEDGTSARLLAVSVGMLLTLIGLVLLVDLHSPISTRRNFIVLVPSFAFSVAVACRIAVSRFQVPRAAVLGLLMLFSASSLQVSYRQVKGKATPLQDWKNAARIAAEHSAGRRVYATYWAAAHYLNRFAGSIAVERYAVGTADIRGPAVLLYGHLKKAELQQLFEQMAAIGAVPVFSSTVADDDEAPASSSMPAGAIGRRTGVFLID